MSNVPKTTISNNNLPDIIANSEIAATTSADMNKTVSDDIEDPVVQPSDQIINENNSILLGEITNNNLAQLKQLYNVVFPGFYADYFYPTFISNGNLARFAYFNNKVVGAICCEIVENDGEKSVYIMAIGVLPEYQRHGVGTQLMQFAVKAAENIEDIKSLSLHVRVTNMEAFQFYLKKGFTVSKLLLDYYYEGVSSAYYLTLPIGK